MKAEKRVRVAVVADTFAETMGYAGTRLPAALAKKPGVDVFLVTAGLPAYYQIADYQSTYGRFHDAPFPPGTVREFDGFEVHYVAYKHAYGGVRMTGLEAKLAELRPDVVQSFAHTGWLAIDCARFQRRLGYKLFTGNHSGKIVYTPAQSNLPPWSQTRIKEFLKRGLPGRFISSRTILCYGATADASEVAWRFFGVPKSKVKTTTLGVDTDLFHPADNDAELAAARALRHALGVADDELLCLYTGRLTEVKQGLVLAKAIAALRAEGHRNRAVFFGAGPEEESIRSIDGSVVHPVVPYKQLGDVYRAADIAVWPAEITTSTLDGAACGIPIVVNDQILAEERYEGNGLTYRLGDVDDLKRVLLRLKDPALRKTLGDEGARKMRTHFSWDALAQERLDDYRAALRRPA